MYEALSSDLCVMITIESIFRRREWRTYDQKRRRFQIAGGTFDHGESESGVAVGLVGTDAAVREQQKQDFGQNQDLVPSSP